MNVERFDPLRLPHVSEGAPGTGGRIKREPRHFAVEEIALYAPSGTGEHVYFAVRREGRTTPELVAALARLFAVRAIDVGCAGRKDKHARATQTFSLPLAGIEPEDAGRRIASELGVEVLSARRHTNKLRRGHLLGNRFDIFVDDVHDEGLARAERIAREIAARGLPNYYGPQRFGADGQNAARGRELLGSTRRDGASRFLLSSFQSLLFNAWLAERLRSARFERVFRGDVGKRTDNGALFDIEEPETENTRMTRREITYTGPIFGARMRRANGEPGSIESDLLQAFAVDAAAFARSHLDGSRRAARLFVEDLAIAREGSGLRLRFSLPKGAYATTLLGEVMKAEVGADAADSSPELDEEG